MLVFNRAAVMAVVAVTAMHARGATGAPADSSSAVDAGPRVQVPLANGWHFKQASGLPGVAAPQFDDTGWDQVRVPHTWNRIGNDGYERSAESNNIQGTGWYRLKFQ